MSAPASHGQRPRPLLRDLMRLQLKLALDALRDLVLSPVALAAAAIDALRGRRDRDALFYRLLRLGQRSEAWIDLWGAAREPGQPHPASVDDLLGHVEAVLRDPRTGPRRARAMQRWLERERRRRLAPPAGDRDGPAD